MVMVPGFVLASASSQVSRIRNIAVRRHSLSRESSLPDFSGRVMT